MLISQLLLLVCCVLVCLLAFKVSLNSYGSWQVEQACSALSSIAADVSVAMQLIKSDIMQPIEAVLRSVSREEVMSVLQVVVQLAFASDTVAQKMLTKDLLKSLKMLCAQKNPEASFYFILLIQYEGLISCFHKTFNSFIDHQVQRLALLAVGNLGFCFENRRLLVTSESLRELLLRLTVGAEPRVNKAAARALAILGLSFLFYPHYFVCVCVCARLCVLF